MDIGQQDIYPNRNISMDQSSFQTMP